MKRKDIKVSNVVSVTQTQGRQVPAFQISFSYENRQLAAKVCADLVSKFMNENTRDRSNQAVFTSQFLGDQWEAAKKELDQIEGRLASFRMKHSGQLPEQYSANLQQLNALEARASGLNSTVSRINQEKLLLESQMRIEKDKLNSLTNTTDSYQTAPPQVVARNEKLAQLDGQIQQQELRIASMRDTYRDSHPDMQRELATLAMLKKQHESAAKQEEAKKSDAAPTPTPTVAKYVSPQTVRELRDGEGRVKQLQSQVEAKDLESEQVSQEMGRVNAAIRALQGRIEVTPMGEKEYQELVRDRDTTRNRYDELNRKKALATMGQALENRQQGESLEVLDPASVPQTPTEPKRPVLIGIGTGLGFLLGLFLAGGREMKDSSLKNLKDVRAYTQLTVLGSIPLLENDLVVRRRRRLGWLAWSTACIVGAVIMTGSMYFYYFVNKT
jgi:succinoglycan biosynthesis transport protein ExoP